jgi:cytochrome c
VVLLGSALSADDLGGARQLAVTQCSQCHTFGKGEPHGQGPNLFGLIGREAAVSGFQFSVAYRTAMKGKSWNATLLDHFLADTQAVAPGTAMVYWQDDPAIRANLVRFLESLR